MLLDRRVLRLGSLRVVRELGLEREEPRVRSGVRLRVARGLDLPVEKLRVRLVLIVFVRVVREPDLVLSKMLVTRMPLFLSAAIASKVYL